MNKKIDTSPKDVVGAAPVEQPPLDAASEDAIAAKLREAFSDVMDEPVPQRFIDLINGYGKDTQQ